MDEFNTATEAQLMIYNSPDEFQRQLQETISKGSLDFDSWISLVAYIEDCYLDDIDTISLVYESFLSKFPLCHVYWKKYADHKTRLCTVKKAVDIYEQAVQAAAYCVSLWVDYCTFSTAAFEDPYDIRRLFERGVSFVGKDYLCHALWDKYIEFECSQNQQSSLLRILIQTLRYPTKKLHEYYNNFKKFAAILDEEREGLNTSSVEVQAEALPCAIMSKININKIIENMQDPSNDNRFSQALQKYLATGEQLYHKACQLEETVHRFETSVGRSFFDVKPLDDMQLANWHSYLDFIEKQDDFDWTVKIYEKCLIPCANYPEFWMRYVEFMETKGGRELANLALERATQIFLENAPVIHIFNARFREHIGDVHGARAAFLHGDENSNVYFVENVVKAANMEKRLGHMAAASSIYENALNLALERKKLHTFPVLYIHYSRLKYLISGSANNAIDVILDGIRHVPRCRLLLEELIKLLMMHEGSKYMTVVDSIIAGAITSETVTSESLSTKDKENLSCLYLEYVDLCGTTDDIRNAWYRHIKLFPHFIRTAATKKNPNATHQLLDMAREVRKILPLDQLPKGHVSDHLIQIPVVEQELLQSQNLGILSDQLVAEKLTNEFGNSAQEETEQLPLGIEALCRDNIAEVESKRKFLLQSEDDVSEEMESTHNGTCAPKIVESELIRFTEGIAKRSEQAACGSQKSIQEFEQSTVVITPSEFLQQSSSSSEIQEMEANERIKHLKPTHLERITLSSQKTQYITSLELQEHGLSQKSCFSDRQILEFVPSDEIHDMSNMKSSSVANSVTIENNAHNSNAVKVSSLTTGQSPTQTQTELQCDQPANSGQNCPQNAINTTPTDRSPELHDHKCPQDGQQHDSIQKECSTSKMSTKVEGCNQGGNQSPLGADLGNVTSDARSVKYMESHVSAPHSELSPQLITTHPQALVSHCSTPTSETQGPNEHNQQHDKMLQYQQQQQEQLLLHQQYQNQMLQLQRQYFQLQQKNQELYQHQQQIQPPPQQIQHHHYLHQTQQLQQSSYQLEQQQYLFYQQQQQLQAGQQEQYTQLLGQEHQAQLQQNVLQQIPQGYQPQLQPYLMQQQEAYQQQNLQQQQAYQQFLQQQDVQQQQAYHQLLQQHLITHDQSNSSYPQGQGIAVLSDRGAAGVSESHKHPFSEGTPEPHKEA